MRQWTDHIREEVLYRAALSLGLDSDDPSSAGACVRPMEFCSRTPSEEPQESELQRIFEPIRRVPSGSRDLVSPDVSEPAGPAMPPRADLAG